MSGSKADLSHLLPLTEEITAMIRRCDEMEPLLTDENQRRLFFDGTFQLAMARQRFHQVLNLFSDPQRQS